MLALGLGCALAVGCSSATASEGQSPETSPEGGTGVQMQPEQDDSGSASATGDDAGGSVQNHAVGSVQSDGGGSTTSTDAGTATKGDGGLPSGWLYTTGNKIMLSDGNGGGAQWMGRGMNISDILQCGYNGSLWNTNAESDLTTMIDGMMKDWKPTFIRISLAMDSYGTAVDWFGDASKYKTPMKTIIDKLASYPGVYVLVSVRSDPSMILQDTVDGDPEATGIPSDSTNTPNKTKYPTGTDALYVDLVDTFAHSPQVMFGITNEAGGNKQSNSTIAKAMNHAVGTIRAEEDKLGVPHHIVSVQGNGWTSDLSFYATTPSPITHDNVVYELHYYPSLTSKPSYYSYSSTIPMIVGEYGGFTSEYPAAGFYSDMESKKIPSTAWDFEPFADCAPDLLNVTGSGAQLQSNSWGDTVKAYLTSHAK
jgi:hypothetical protein